MPAALEDILVERTPGLARGRTARLMPTKEIGLGEEDSEKNSKILVAGRGEAGSHTCSQLEDLSLALLPSGPNTQKPVLSTLPASLLLPSSHQGGRPQTREQTLKGLVKGSGASALGTQPAGGNARPWGCCPKQDSCSTVLTPACLQAHSQRPGRRRTDQWMCLPATMRCLTHSLPTRPSAGLTGRCRGTDPVPTLPRSFAGTMSTLGLKQHKLNISALLLSPNHFLSRYYLERPQQVVNPITCLLQKLAGPYRTKMGKCTND